MLDKWQFTDLYKHANRLCKYSPDGNYVAVAVDNQLLVRSHPDLGILHAYQCQWRVDVCGWSPNSKMVFAVNYKACQFETFTMEDVGWRCRYKDISRPLAHTRWSPDSDAIMFTTTAKVGIL